MSHSHRNPASSGSMIVPMNEYGLRCSMKIAWGKNGAGLVLAFVIGAACQKAGVPVPAPTALLGALLVLALTSGYLLADQWLAGRRLRGSRRNPGEGT